MAPERDIMVKNKWSLASLIFISSQVHMLGLSQFLLSFCYKLRYRIDFWCAIVEPVPIYFQYIYHNDCLFLLVFFKKNCLGPFFLNLPICSYFHPLDPVNGKFVRGWIRRDRGVQICTPFKIQDMLFQWSMSISTDQCQIKILLLIQNVAQ